MHKSVLTSESALSRVSCPSVCVTYRCLLPDRSHQSPLPTELYLSTRGLRVRRDLAPGGQREAITDDSALPPAEPVAVAAAAAAA